ncbi:unnamed protein product [Mycena citricolor]|uniref:Uncharacterized protein n=1 Tax=Mycena citricolor TaxID=2018698 RepID=A0AAD2HN29_9AGAR|nr:unnamed protein product [Mycena citricolor]
MQITLLFATLLGGISVVSAGGRINKPVAGTTITSKAVVPFKFKTGTINGGCHQIHTPVTIYLSTSAPTALNADGGLDPGSFIESYGPFFEPEMGIRPLPGFPVPPSELTMPDISAYSPGTALFLTAVETTAPGACAPGVNPARYDFASINLIVA